MRKLGAWLLISALLLTMLPESVIPVLAEEIEDVTETLEESVSVVFGEEKLGGKCGDNLTWAINEETKTLTISGTGEMYDYGEVAEFGDCSEAAPWMPYITRRGLGQYKTEKYTVLIEDGVTGIGDYAFEASRITNVTLPDSLESIGDSAFAGCNDLDNTLTLPDSVRTIGKFAFSNGFFTMENITIPKSMVSIGPYAFFSCGKGSLTIPDHIIQIDTHAFSGSKWDEIIVPDSVKYLVGAPFYCAGISKITLPKNLTVIAESYFEGCQNLSSIEIPESVGTIDTFAFRSCTSLREITIPENVGWSLGSGAFYGCSSLETVTIKGRVYILKSWLFERCENLTSVSIPNSVGEIDSGAFKDCNSLKDVYYEGSKADWEKITINEFENDALLNATIHYLSSSEPTTSVDKTNLSGTIDVTAYPINGSGYAFYQAVLHDTTGAVMANTDVTYSNGGGSITTKSDSEGAVVFVTPTDTNNTNRSQSKSCTISYTIGETTGSFLLKYAIDPVTYSESYLLGASAGISGKTGVGAMANLGPVQAGVGAMAQLGANVGNELMGEIDFFGDQKSADLSYRQSVRGSASGSVFAGAKVWNHQGKATEDLYKGSPEFSLTAGEISANASAYANQSIGVTLSDLDTPSSENVQKLGKLLGATILEANTTDVLARKLIEPLLVESGFVDVRSGGYGASVGAGATVGGLKAGPVEAKLFGGSAGASYRYEKSTKADGTTTYTARALSSERSQFGTIALSSVGSPLDGSQKNLSGETHYLQNDFTVKATEKNGMVDTVQIKGSYTKNTGIIVGQNQDVEYWSATVTGNEAIRLASQNEAIRDMVKSSQLISISEVDALTSALSASDVNHTIESSKSIQAGASFPIDLGVSIGVGVGLSAEVHGSYTKDYDTAVTHSVNDNQTIGVSSDPTIPDTSYLGTLIEEGVQEISARISAGIATIRKEGRELLQAIKTGALNIIAASAEMVEKLSTYTLVISRMTESAIAQSYGSLPIEIVYENAYGAEVTGQAVTVGEPYMIGLQDADGNFVEDFPAALTARLSYDDEHLAEAGVSGEEIQSIAVYRYDSEAGAYELIPGELNTEEKYVEFSMTKAGEYLLAVDTEAPTIGNIRLSDEGTKPTIYALISDVSGIANMSMKLDGTELVNADNFAEYLTESSFAYAVSNELSIGTHELVFWAEDSSGNRSEEVTFSFETKETSGTGGETDTPTGIYVKGLDASYPYTGKAIKPAFSVYHGSTLLKEKTDYTLSYKKNTNPGTATITIKMKGNYSGSKNVTFTIGARSLSDVTIDPISVAYKKGKKQTPTPVLTVNGTKLKFSKSDLTVTYPSTGTSEQTAYVDPGTYQIHLAAPSGSKKFSGERDVTLTITNSVLIGAVKIKADKNSYAYTGSAITPSFTVTYKGKPVDATAYTTTYADTHTEIGKHTVIFAGNGTDLIGQRAVTFQITGKYDLSAATVKLNSADLDTNGAVPYTPGGAKPGVTVTLAGKTLTAGTDYTVSYQSNKSVGSASVTVTGKGSYKNSARANFIVAKRDISTLALNLEDVAYSSKAGKFFPPRLTITDQNYKSLGMKKGQDYTITCTSHAATDTPEAGSTISVTIAGIGNNYTGSVNTSYKIIAKSHDFTKAKIKVNGGKSYAYTGSAITPTASELIVTIGGKPVSSFDYEILGAYNNVKKGTAVLRVRGKGSYAGVKTVKYKIGAVSIASLWQTIVESLTS